MLESPRVLLCARHRQVDFLLSLRNWEGCLDRGFSWLLPNSALMDFRLVPRPPALPVMPHRRGWLQGVVHRLVELLNYPLSPGSRQGRTPGETQQNERGGRGLF